jgi:hypothetical protein
LTHLGGRQFAIRADLQIADPNRSDGHAHQLQHLRAQGFHHTPYLSIPALRNGDLEEGVARRVANPIHNRRPRGTIVKLHARAQAIELFVAQQQRTFHQIRLCDL